MRGDERKSVERKGTEKKGHGKDIGSRHWKDMDMDMDVDVGRTWAGHRAGDG